MRHTQRRGSRWAMANVLVSLGHVSRAQGDSAQAERYYRESLVAQENLDNPVYVALSLEGLAAVASDAGRHEQAITLCAAAARLRDEARAPAPEEERMTVEQTLAHARAGMDTAAAEAAWNAGEALTLKQAIARALE